MHSPITDFGFNLSGVSNNGRSITGFSGAGVFLDPNTLVGVNDGFGGSDASPSGSSVFLKFTPAILAWVDEIKTNYVPAIVSGPKLGFNHSPISTNLVLSWVGMYHLQSATNVAGPFVTVTNATSPYTNSMSAPQEFFRLAATNAP